MRLATFFLPALLRVPEHSHSYAAEVLLCANRNHHPQRFTCLFSGWFLLVTPHRLFLTCGSAVLRQVRSHSTESNIPRDVSSRAPGHHSIFSHQVYFEQSPEQTLPQRQRTEKESQSQNSAQGVSETVHPAAWLADLCGSCFLFIVFYDHIHTNTHVLQPYICLYIYGIYISIHTHKYV